jgi:phosphoribosylformylglycinamidine synthase subunit PurQ / glutaminase
MIRVLILRGFGFNCEEETHAAYAAVSAAPTVVHAADWFSGEVRLDAFDVLHVPGGFSFGDDLGSGQVFANRVRHARFESGGSLWDSLLTFLARGGRVFGVCNGFQALVRLGLLPNLSGNHVPEVSLAPNLSGHFEDRWVRCKATGLGERQFGSRSFEFPVRHGEGRLVFESDAVRKECQRLGLVALQYAGPTDDPTQDYPQNPNGAEESCAGLFSKDGQVFGLMPHPEAFLTPENHPAWAVRKRKGTLTAEADGVTFLRALLASPDNQPTKKDAQ